MGARSVRAFLLGPLLATGIAGVASAQSVGGNYSVSGTNPDGSAYTGTAHITLKESACRISWQTGSTTSEGVCMLANNAFAAFYKLGSAFGLVVYELQPDGKLKGYWRIVDKEGVGGEVLIPRN